MAVRNRRMISNTISTSTRLYDKKMTSDGRFLFTWMITHCDDEGRMDGHPQVVKATVVPMEDWSTEYVETLLKTLKTCRLIDWYGTKGVKTLQICNWDKFQTFHGVKKIPSSYPTKEHQKGCSTTPDLVSKLREVKVSKGKLREGKAWDDSLAVIDLYNSLSFIKRPISLSIIRHDKIVLRTTELLKTKTTWQDVMDAIEEQPFTHGKNKRNWKLDFDWLVKNDSNWQKIIERKYADAQNSDEPEAWGILRESMGGA